MKSEIKQVVAAGLLAASAGSLLWAQGSGSDERLRRFWGPTSDYPPRVSTLAARKASRPRLDTMGRLHHWNSVAVDASGLDHTPVGEDEVRTFGEQIGPGRSARAMAIVHIAVFEAMVSIVGGYQSYLGLPRVRDVASVDAAIARAAHDTLTAMFPSQRASFATELDEDLRQIPPGRAKANGIAAGRRAAAVILARRQHDGSHHEEPLVGVDYITSNEPGKWRQDPISLIPVALGAYWGKVKPFVIPTAASFRVAPPPSLHSREYAAAFHEVKRLGGDGVITPTKRTDDQTHIGIYWAYDGTPTLCAPPRLYNQLALTIAAQRRGNAMQTARLLALINIAMADAGVAIWESKYFYQVGRPVTVIREAPARAGGDPTFTPKGAPASNLVTAHDFTPPFPAYPSGHAGFGGALFQVLRRFYGTDRIAFTFVSDEFNGVTEDHFGVVRPLLPRSFTSLSQAEEENGQSRIYLGIHWSFDKTMGIQQGRRIGNYVYDHVFAPTR